MKGAAGASSLPSWAKPAETGGTLREQPCARPTATTCVDAGDDLDTVDGILLLSRVLCLSQTHCIMSSLSANETSDSMEGYGCPSIPALPPRQSPAAVRHCHRTWLLCIRDCSGIGEVSCGYVEIENVVHVAKVEHALCHRLSASTSVEPPYSRGRCQIQQSHSVSRV